MNLYILVEYEKRVCDIYPRDMKIIYISPELKDIKDIVGNYPSVKNGMGIKSYVSVENNGTEKTFWCLNYKNGNNITSNPFGLNDIKRRIKLF